MELLGKRGDCAECLPPLMEENRDAVKVYLLCRRQMIFAGLGEPVDINHMAVHEAMRLYRVRDRRDCFERVLAVNAHMMELAAEERETEADGKTPDAWG